MNLCRAHYGLYGDLLYTKFFKTVLQFEKILFNLPTSYKILGFVLKLLKSMQLIAS